jgi:glycosyltransferase involved in cell wall biosynthesis
MRILYSTLNLEKAGSHVVALTLASGTAEANRHQVYYFNQGEQLVNQGMVEAYLSPKVRLIDMKSYPKLNFLAWKANAVLRKLGVPGFHEACKTALLLFTIVRHRIDLVHGHEALVKNSRLAKVIRFLSVPVVITDHSGYTMLLKVGDRSFIPYANQARAIVEVSEYSANILRHRGEGENSAKMRELGKKIMAADYQAEYDNLKDKDLVSEANTQVTTRVVTIYNGVVRHQGTPPNGPQIRQQLGLTPDTLVFGMIGRGTEQKGWLYALEAYKQLTARHPERRCAWLCMGEGPCLEQMQAELGTTRPDILFVGSVDDPHYYMSACDVGLVPSCFSEGLPLSIVEFFEHGVPVIGSDLCGIPEAITPPGQEPGGLLIAMDEGTTPLVESLRAHMERYVLEP